MRPLGEALIQRLIMKRIYRAGFVLPNYTPRGWWECDVFYVTRAGYFKEYEIKLTVGDFKQDKKKGRNRWGYRQDTKGNWQPGYYITDSKHAALQKREHRGPTQFWYVTPEGLLYTEPAPQFNPEALVPDYAGLLEVVDVHGWLRLKEVKRAPRLHCEKVSAKFIEAAQRVPYWRMHDLLESWRLERSELRQEAKG